MTRHAVLDWLAQRDAASPPALASRVRAIATEASAPGESAPEAGAAAHAVAPAGEASPDAGVAAVASPAAALVHATGRVLERLLREHETARTSALELLAADALATYAMEALGDHPALLESQCEQAMRFFAERADTA